jgi:hypothetical protein
VEKLLSKLQPHSEPYARELKRYIRRNSTAYDVTQYPAHIAKTLVTMFNAQHVLDLSAGWGDRLSGFLASSCRTITLIEPRQSACVKYGQQHEAVKQMISPKTLNIQKACAEDALATVPDGSVDLIHTSIPYFNCERYPYDKETDARQAWCKFKTCDDFNTGFLTPVLKNSLRVLSAQGVLALNVDNTDVHQTLCQDVLTCAGEVGLAFVGTAGLCKGGSYEPIYVFCRPGQREWVQRRMSLPPPIVEPVVLEDGRTIHVVRDDLMPGGTKRRGISAFIAAHPQHREYVYASPCEGHAQLGLAHACKDRKRKAVVYTFQREAQGLHPVSKRAKTLGADIRDIRSGGQSVIEAHAKQYCGDNTGACLLPFGCDDPIIIGAIKEAALSIPLETAPTEVWCTASSGVLSRGLQAAWPAAKHYAVRVGHNPTPEQLGGATLIESGYKTLTHPCRKKDQPPFSSSRAYDAKAWARIKESASDGALFWNVGGEIEK